MYTCPECKGELYWIADQKEDKHISLEYRCEKCDIDVIKHKQSQEDKE